jgi:hypothetical protein
MKKHFQRYLSLIDIIGPQVNLSIYSNTKYKTLLGGLLTLFSLMLLGGFSLYFAFEIFGKKQPSVIQSRVPNKDPKFNYTQNPIMIGLAGPGLGVSLNESFYRVRATYYNFDMDAFTSDQYPLNTTYCNPSLYGNNKQFDDFLFTPFLWCVDIETSEYIKDHLIYGQVGSVDSNGFIGFFIDACVNDRDGSGIICHKDRDFQLSNIYLIIVFVDYYIDNNSFEHPGTPFLNIMTFSINPTVYKGFVVAVEDYQYLTDKGLIFYEEDKKSFYTIQAGFESTDLRSPGTLGEFASVYLTCSKVKNIYNRKYPKLQDLFAMIGGVSKGIFLVLAFIEQFILNKSLYFDLYNELLKREPYKIMGRELLKKHFSAKTAPLNLEEKEFENKKELEIHKFDIPQKQVKRVSRIINQLNADCSGISKRY